MPGQDEDLIIAYEGEEIYDEDSDDRELKTISEQAKEELINFLKD
jgi:hypothetical protein